MEKRWSEQQLGALDAVESWLDGGAQSYFYLAGYAGTGKSTLAAEVGRRHRKVLFAAFTGKAALVMRQKGCDEACTIDSLIYHARVEARCAADPPCQRPPCRERCKYLRESFVGRKLNPNSAVADANLVIVDEISMVGKAMACDLLSFGTPILVLGDTAQLPPIGDLGFFIKRKPNYRLTQVHRQAAGSPIIELATMARKSLLPLRCGDYGDNSAVVDGISIKKMLGFDQVIVGTHRMRHYLNQEIRRKLGFRSKLPERGEKIICLKNHRHLNLLNGQTWWVRKAQRFSFSDGFVALEVENNDGRVVDVVAPEQGFTAQDGNSGADLPGAPFAFGYAITCHKAQGSQWDSVLVIDESDVFREHRRAWLYTAITRAAKSVVISP
jgi:ATP-dependent exoDNAse (exonuclease V) alpha subunit